MVFTTQQKAKAIECFFRTGVRINGEWQYSLHDCMTDFREEYPDLVFNYNYFRDVVTKSVQLFRESGSVAVKVEVDRRLDEQKQRLKPPGRLWMNSQKLPLQYWLNK